ncbi:MAG: hydrolase [Oscillospiraceae bacterium]|nr:hydrolase [Oscillospiraceae bacterium]
MRKYQKSLLDPEQCAVLIIDHEPQMYFGVESHSRRCIMHNTAALIKSAKTFGVPVILTTVTEKEFSGPMAKLITDYAPECVPIDRTAINCWEDDNLKNAVVATKRKKLILSGLWTEACITFPALCMLEDNYEVFVVEDACGGASKAAHCTAMKRMVQAGVVPMTWQQVLLEFQRDWSNKDTYQAVMDIVTEYGGAYGLGVEYAQAMVPAYAQG